MRKNRRYPAPAAVARRRWGGVMTRRGYAKLFWKLAVVAAAVWVLLSQVFLVTQTKGQGMLPTVRDGDLVLAYRLQREYAKDDLVVYRVGDTLHLGRVAARESDVIMIQESGDVMVNGTTQDSGILFPTYPREGAVYPYEVQAGTLYILGDHRTGTQDSRDFGPIPLSDIQGKVITLLRRRSL